MSNALNHGNQRPFISYFQVIVRCLVVSLYRKKERLAKNKALVPLVSAPPIFPLIGTIERFIVTTGSIATRKQDNKKATPKSGLMS